MITKKTEGATNGMINMQGLYAFLPSSADLHSQTQQDVSASYTDILIFGLGYSKKKNFLITQNQ